ncbi:MAG: sodium:proton antiporter NhaD [Bacteroidaceae bacterium]|nr:sodium:proton antiporter NhaD [Bacteroidaceae bacterium]
MLFTTLIIVAVLLLAFLVMSTEPVNHLNRAAVAMCCGVVVWVVYLLHAGDYIHLVHPEEYSFFLSGTQSSTDSVKEFVSHNIIIHYISEACSVILFLIATNTIIEVLHNNGVFDSLVSWLRMRNSRLFLWIVSLLTFVLSANVDNLTTVVLMMGLVGNIVRSHYQRIVYACSIMVSAMLGGCFTVIGDMTSLMLWVRGLVTPTAFSTRLILPAIASLCVFNLLIGMRLIGRVEVVSIFNRYDGDDSYLRAWQKILLLILGIGGLWFIPTFHVITKLPPFLGALSVLALMWIVEGLCNLERNGNVLLVQRHYFRNTEFIGMRMILYFLGISLCVGALTECGALAYVGHWLDSNINNVYAYGVITGLLSSFLDNVPLMMMGMNMFPLDTAAGSTSEFVMNGSYWQLLSFCCAMGGSTMFVGTMAGQAVLQVEHMHFGWMLRHYTWRVFLAWAAGLLVFWLTH